MSTKTVKEPIKFLTVSVTEGGPDGPLVARGIVTVPYDALVWNVAVSGFYTTAPKLGGAGDGSDLRSRAAGSPRFLETRLVTWPSVEAIAAYVRGDGTDAQRQALADGILEYRPDRNVPGTAAGVSIGPGHTTPA